MAEFTNGPWSVGDHVWHTDEATGAGYRFRQITFNGGCLAWVADDEGDSEGPANSSLVAAAPDMHGELEALVETLREGRAVHIEPGTVWAARLLETFSKATATLEECSQS